MVEMLNFMSCMLYVTHLHGTDTPLHSVKPILLVVSCEAAHALALAFLPHSSLCSYFRSNFPAFFQLLKLVPSSCSYLCFQGCGLVLAVLVPPWFSSLREEAFSLHSDQCAGTLHSATLSHCFYFPCSAVWECLALFSFNLLPACLLPLECKPWAITLQP